MPTSLQNYLTVDWPVLVTAAVALVASISATFISREDVFKKNAQTLLQKFLDKKVAALRLLFDSIEFTPTTLGEVRDFKGKRYFTEVDKYGALEQKVLSLLGSYRKTVSCFHYAIVAALLITLASFFRITYVGGIAAAGSIFLIISTVVGILMMRRKENFISKLLDMDELKHDE